MWKTHIIEEDEVYVDALVEIARTNLVAILPKDEEDLDPWEYGHDFGYRIQFSDGDVEEENYDSSRYCPVSVITHFIYDGEVVAVCEYLCDTGD